jgi:hypothetical protein
VSLGVLPHRFESRAVTVHRGELIGVFRYETEKVGPRERP